MDLEQKAIERLKYAEQVSFQLYGLPPVLCYSGGKDSDVLLELTKRAGIKFEIQHSHTTVDAQQTVYHIREILKRCEEEAIQCTVNKPIYKGKPVTMWQLIPQKSMPPSRMQRYCCHVLKEQAANRRLILTGVRWSESVKRKGRGILEQNTNKVADKTVFMDDNDENRRQFERCELKAKTTINPIIEWPDVAIWDFLASQHITTNPLYAECGFRRVGCIGCPMAGKMRWTEFRLWPTYEQAYRRAFAKMLEVRKAKHPDKLTKWKTADDVFRWWMEDKNLDGQIGFDDLIAGSERNLQ